MVPLTRKQMALIGVLTLISSSICFVLISSSGMSYSGHSLSLGTDHTCSYSRFFVLFKIQLPYWSEYLWNSALPLLNWFAWASILGKFKPVNPNPPLNPDATSAI